MARSSTEAEYRSMAFTVAELYWLHMFFHEFHIPLTLSLCLWVDNIWALTLSFNPVFNARIKHIEVDYHFVREKILNKDLQAHYTSIYDQPSISLLKASLLHDSSYFATSWWFNPSPSTWGGMLDKIYPSQKNLMIHKQS